MRINLDLYRTPVKPVIESWLNRSSEMDIRMEIGLMAISTGCHIVAVVYYVGEVDGFTPEVLKLIESLEKFYDITEVIGKI